MKVTIYHGSDHIIEKPEYGKGKRNKDYGLGFYTTEDEELALEWAVDLNRNGYANEYELDLSELKILDLSSPGYSILHWITILIENRKFDLNNDVSRLGKEYLISKYHIDTSSYDIIKGYRADDTYFAYANSFLNNTISLRRLSEALTLGHLGEQIVLVSKKAFERITYISSSCALASLYYPKREERNTLARNAFLSNKKGKVLPDDVFLMDLIRGEKK